MPFDPKKLDAAEVSMWEATKKLKEVPSFWLMELLIKLQELRDRLGADKAKTAPSKFKGGELVRVVDASSEHFGKSARVGPHPGFVHVLLEGPLCETAILAEKSLAPYTSDWCGALNPDWPNDLKSGDVVEVVYTPRLESTHFVGQIGTVRSSWVGDGKYEARTPKGSLWCSRDMLRRVTPAWTNTQGQTTIRTGDVVVVTDPADARHGDVGTVVSCSLDWIEVRLHQPGDPRACFRPSQLQVFGFGRQPQLHAGDKVRVLHYPHPSLAFTKNMTGLVLGVNGDDAVVRLNLGSTTLDVRYPLSMLRREP